jgi:flagellar biosynthetic protein FliR
MISFTSAQLTAWIVAFIYPVARILAFASTAPFLNNPSLPRRTRLLLGLALAVSITPTLAPMPAIVPTSAAGILLLIQQILIGVGMGFSMRIIFAGIEFAGQVIGTQMGIGFATFYDPLNTSQTVVIANLTTMIATLLFLSLNGHLIYFATLAESFRVIPITLTPIPASAWKTLTLMGGQIFVIGLILSLPAVTALLITNLALGVLNRAAPQLNLFGIGFPIILAMGFICLALSFSYMATPLQHFFEEGMNTMLQFAAPPKP